VGEFGGIGVFIPNHQWNPGSQWGYIQEKPAGLKAKYTIMNQHLKLYEADGMSGSIYTQPFDVESEQNGLMTYDREVVKIPFAELRKIHGQLNPDLQNPSWLAQIGDVTAQDADLTEPAQLYSAILQQYIDGKRDAAFLKQMAMMASQTGDKNGASLAGNAYLGTLKAPLSDEDIASVAQFAKSSKDAGFKLMLDHAADFKKVLGDRQYTVNMMNMIFKGDMEPLLADPAKIDWAAIEAKVKPYGAPAEEILLRAKTVHFYNKQEWPEYVTSATAYLNKYGNNITAQEKGMFQGAIDQHKGGAAPVASAAQSSDEETAPVQDIKAVDEKLKAELIDPAIAKANEAGAAPDWTALTKTVAAKYDAVTAERNVTRAKLFFYYGKDWKAFASAIVVFTEKYEDNSNLPTMLTNANFVLEHSTDKAELAKALAWANMLVEKEPNNEDYKKTLEGLKEKIK
jgi:hypothetical protein